MTRGDAPTSIAEAIHTIAENVSRELRSVRGLLAGLGEPRGPQDALTDEWTTAVRGLFGPDGVLDALTAPERVAEARSDAA